MEGKDLYEDLMKQLRELDQERNRILLETIQKMDAAEIEELRKRLTAGA